MPATNASAHAPAQIHRGNLEIIVCHSVADSPAFSRAGNYKFSGDLRVKGQALTTFHKETPVRNLLQTPFLVLQTPFLETPFLGPGMADRVAQGGHNIPETVIRRRFTAGRGNFLKLYKPLADAWRHYDNAGDQPVLIASSDQT